MPPSDKYGWWEHNPQVLEGNATDRFLLLLDRRTNASRVYAVMYGRQDERVAILELTYDSPTQAVEELRLIRKHSDPREWLVRLSRHERDTVVLMTMTEDCSAEEFFKERLDTMARGNP